jgi:hypothetical protein
MHTLYGLKGTVTHTAAAATIPHSPHTLAYLAPVQLRVQVIPRRADACVRLQAKAQRQDHPQCHTSAVRALHLSTRHSTSFTLFCFLSLLAVTRSAPLKYEAFVASPKPVDPQSLSLSMDGTYEHKSETMKNKKVE